MKIIDDFLSPEEHKTIYNLFSSNEFPWKITTPTHKPLTLANDTIIPEEGQEMHMLLTHGFFKPFAVDSDFYKIVIPLINRLKCKALIRLKANAYPHTKEIVKHHFHTDFEFECKTALYYVNTNNGYTLFKDGTKVESVANRVLIFNSTQPHASTSCTDKNYRYNINMNYY